LIYLASYQLVLVLPVLHLPQELLVLPLLVLLEFPLLVLPQELVDFPRIIC
jgi:hypothetical protein